MATTVFEPPNIHSLAEDAASSTNMSLYTSGVQHRIASGDIVFDSGNHTRNIRPRSVPQKLTESELSEEPIFPYVDTSAKKSKREFPVTRKNSYKKSTYFKLYSKPVLSKDKINRRKSCRFGNPKQLEPVFEIHPESSILENPSYMIQYFTKTLELIKKNPNIQYQVLKAHIDLDNEIPDKKSLQEIKQKKYQSLPVPNRANTIKRKLIENQKNKRKSAPTVLSYEPSDMTMEEYLNTPLSFYRHRKQYSDASTTDQSKETRLSDNTNATSNNMSNQTGSSISTTALYLNRNLFNEDSKAGKRHSLKTKKKDDIIKKKNIVFKSEEELIPSVRNSTGSQKDKYLLKYGTPLLQSGFGQAVVKPRILKNIRPISDCATESIATATEYYNNIKTDLFSQRFNDWDSAFAYINEEYPELKENDYILARIMFEIYLRRVLAARISMKLGSDKKNKGATIDIWAGLKESISAVYGDENASFFQR